MMAPSAGRQDSLEMLRVQIGSQARARTQASYGLSKAREELQRSFERSLPALAQVIRSRGRCDKKDGRPGFPLRPDYERDHVLRVSLDGSQVLFFLSNRKTPLVESPAKLDEVLSLLGDDPLGRLLQCLGEVAELPAPTGSGVVPRVPLAPPPLPRSQPTSPRHEVRGPVVRRSPARLRAVASHEQLSLSGLVSGEEMRSAQYEQKQALRVCPTAWLHTPEGRFALATPVYDRMDDGD